MSSLIFPHSSPCSVNPVLHNRKVVFCFRNSAVQYCFFCNQFLLFKSGQDSDAVSGPCRHYRFWKSFDMFFFIFYFSFYQSLFILLLDFIPRNKTSHLRFRPVSSVNMSQCCSDGFAFPPTVVNKNAVPAHHQAPKNGLNTD